jgi:phosphoribosyl 1,2-cyclic phosphodiesterase
MSVPSTDSISVETLPKPEVEATSGPAAKLRFWGVRGSTPTSDRDTLRYGGNTPCVELTTPEGTRIILDCGTGIRNLGKNWESGANGSLNTPHIFVTHYHWDHIQGIPFFSPFYMEQYRFHFYGFRSEYLGTQSLRRAFETQMTHPYFPVGMGAMAAGREFTEVAGGDQFDIPGARVTARWLNHPQGCLGFRFETSAGTIVYATDNEPGDPKLDQSLRDLVADADIFINDAQFPPDQLRDSRRAWGHSSWLAGVKTAKDVGAKNLVLFHHDPDSTDKKLDGILRDAREKFANVWTAAEGMAMTLEQRKLDVAIPNMRTGTRQEAHFRASVTGVTDSGQSFEEPAIIRDLNFQGALILLDHCPKLQSELRVMLETTGTGEPSDGPLNLRGYVVRIEHAVEKGRTAVGIVFTD